MRDGERHRHKGKERVRERERGENEGNKSIRNEQLKSLAGIRDA